MQDIECPYCKCAIHPGHIDSHKTKCQENKSMDAIQLTTPLMKIKSFKGSTVSINWIKKAVIEQHQWFLDNPEESLIYTTTGAYLVFSHRADGEISTWITEIKARGFADEPTETKEQPLSKFRNISIE